MNGMDTESQERVRNFIDQNNIRAEIIVLSGEATRTSALAANSLGCTIAEIAKTIGFAFKNSAKPTAVLVILSGDKRVSTAKLSNHFGAGLRKMNAEEVKRLTGYPIGGVPPFPHHPEVRVVADYSLVRFESVWAAAGSPNSVMKLSPEILFQLNIPKAEVSE
jgi:prolyl-tRNA editing enzyme YbaK/EbsC (Cys-tRNA(Pro) deacylase)